MMSEFPVAFQCQSQTLIGVIHKPEQTHRPFGVLIIVGGPQTRVGSHRQFVLLARYLCQHGIPVMRFDYRAMGDSGGSTLDYEAVDQDIKEALNQFQTAMPELEQFTLWGLCDAVCAALFYAYQDSRVKGLVLLNPWVRTESGEAKAYLKHYYLRRVISKDFWRKALNGKLNITQSVRSLLGNVRKTYFSNVSKQKPRAMVEAKVIKRIDPDLSLPDRMLQGMQNFNGEILIILSGNHDYVADEFRDVVNSSEQWRKCLANGRVSKKDFDAADHTFSSKAWRGQVERWTLEWLQQRQG